MRLEILKSGHRFTQKPFLALVRALAGKVPGPVATLSYRPSLFGKAFSGCLQEAMRGRSQWSILEREILAAFVSQLNQCRY